MLYDPVTSSYIGGKNLSLLKPREKFWLISEGPKQQMTSVFALAKHALSEQLWWWSGCAELYLCLSTCSVFTYISVPLPNPLFEPYTSYFEDASANIFLVSHVIKGCRTTAGWNMTTVWQQRNCYISCIIKDVYQIVLLVRVHNLTKK